MINRVVLVGRLTKDPELKVTPSGISKTEFTLAVNRTFTNQNGEREADFIQIECWRKIAENAANFLKKGSLVGISGSIRTGSYESQDGKRVYFTNVVADSIQFLESKNTSNSTQNQFSSSSQQNYQSSNQNGYSGQNTQDNDQFTNNGVVTDDELPF